MRCLAWLLALQLGLAASAQAEEARPLTIALTRDAAAAPLLIAVAQHDFAAEGVAPRLSFLDSDAAVTETVAAGRADIGLAATSEPFFAAAAGHGLKIIAARSSDQTRFPIAVLLVGAKARAAGLSGLRVLSAGRIGVTDPQAGAYYALFDVAQRFSIAAQAIRTQPLGSEARTLAALRQGSVDAVLLSYAEAARLAHPDEAILRLSDFAQWQQGVVFAAGSTIAQRHDLVARFMRGYQRGTAEYQLDFQHYDDGGDFIPGPHYAEELALVAHQIGMAPALLAATKRYCDRRGNPDADDLGRQIRFWQERGKLDRKIAPADLLDLSFIGEEIAGSSTAPL